MFKIHILYNSTEINTFNLKVNGLQLPIKELKVLRGTTFTGALFAVGLPNSNGQQPDAKLSELHNI